MEGQQGQDRGSPASLSTLPLHDGDGPLPDNQTDQPRSPKDERIASPNPSVNAAVAGSGRLAIYNENGSLLFHPAYAYDPQVAYGQFSPFASPVSPIMIDGQLYSPHQVPMSPSYYSQPVSPTDLATPASGNQEGLGDNVFLGAGSGYYLHYPGNNGLGFYQFSGDGSSSEPVSSQSTPVGILGPYEHSFGQQQTPYHGYELSGSTTRRYPQSGSYEASRLNHHGHDKEVKQRDRDSISLTGESHATTSDRNRGPRASKPKGSSSVDPMSNNHASRSHLDLYNRPDFVTTYEKAKFFVIKSFSEDNVHRSIKYGVWASTPLGNRKLDAAYQEAQEAGGSYPIFLFFSVNASGQFCGVAEMVGPVDFENDAEYWQQDRWSGQFRVQWHIIKDVKLEEGIAMLKIFKEHDSETSILDDFHFYDEREKCLQEKKVKMEQAKNNVDDGSSSSINELSDRVAESLQLEKQ
ncbi:YTH domain-containing protein [Cynara cardunculus var. scolymus]|uniref:YTH domain-containing family protein n=1 Tax=Cynara cardunculus var. scolymus TaxID=59895 RepID=A0A103Y2S7_CYNCS|nr:YTH domain-containing protein [Cynara cardunculus var. scolymus]